MQPSRRSRRPFPSCGIRARVRCTTPRKATPRRCPSSPVNWKFMNCHVWSDCGGRGCSKNTVLVYLGILGGSRIWKDSQESVSIISMGSNEAECFLQFWHSWGCYGCPGAVLPVRVCFRSNGPTWLRDDLTDNIEYWILMDMAMIATGSSVPK